MEDTQQAYTPAPVEQGSTTIHLPHTNVAFNISRPAPRKPELSNTRLKKMLCHYQARVIELEVMLAKVQQELRDSIAIQLAAQKKRLAEIDKNIALAKRLRDSEDVECIPTKWIRTPDEEGIAPLKARDGSEPKTKRGTRGFGSTGR